MDFASLTKLYFNYDGSQGRLNGRYDFSGRGDDARTMEGRGDLAVTEGNVFAIPFLGPLSGILNTIVPGMGYNVARKAAASFTIRDGVIATNNLEVQGHGFSMIGGGQALLPRRPDGLQHADQCAGPARRAAFPGEQTLRIHRRRETLEADLAAEDAAQAVTLSGNVAS